MMWLIVVMNIFTALVFTLSKEVIPVISPIWFLAMRMCAGGIFFILWYVYTKVVRKKRIYIPISRSYVITLTLLSLFSVYLASILQLWSLNTLEPAKASLLFNVNPFMILILGYLFMHEKITARKLGGLFCGWLGLTISLVYGSNGVFDFTISTGEMLIIGAALATAISAVLLQRVMRKSIYPLALTNGISMLGGAVMSAVHGLMSNQPILLAPLSSSAIVSAVIITISTVICAALYAYLLKFYRATFVSFTGFLAPLFAALFEWLIFGMVVSWPFYVAMALISVGLYLFYQDDRIHAK